MARAGARLAFFLPLRPFDYRVSAADYTALVLFNGLLWVAAAAVRTGFEGEFDSAALLIYLASVPLALVTGMLVALAFGMAAIVAAVRFKSNLNDTRDAAFMLCGIGLGLSAGVHPERVAGRVSLDRF